MKIYEVSQQTKKQAEAAVTLGFDVVKRYRNALTLANCTMESEIDKNMFREIEEGEIVSLPYLVYSDEINEIYKKKGIMNENNHMV